MRKLGTEEVILVNDQDEPLGTMEKVEAHRQGALHRAFSVVLYNPEGQMLIQRRAACKYHSPGLWSNACCSHPRPGESLEDAVQRRLKEELGITCPVEHAYSFIYKIAFDNGLTEHELDHVFVGTVSENLAVNPREVSEFTFTSPDELLARMEKSPAMFTFWFQMIMKKLNDGVRDFT